MTLDELFDAAKQLAQAEHLPEGVPLRADAVARYLDRLGHVANLLLAVELKKAELEQLVALAKQETKPSEQRVVGQIGTLLEQIRLYIDPFKERWSGRR